MPRYIVRDIFDPLERAVTVEAIGEESAKELARHELGIWTPGDDLWPFAIARALDEPFSSVPIVPRKILEVT